MQLAFGLLFILQIRFSNTPSLKSHPQLFISLFWFMQLALAPYGGRGGGGGGDFQTSVFVPNSQCNGKKRRCLLLMPSRRYFFFPEFKHHTFPSSPEKIIILLSSKSALRITQPLQLEGEHIVWVWSWRESLSRGGHDKIRSTSDVQIKWPL